MRPASAPVDAPPILDRATDLATSEAALQPRAWVLDTSMLPAGTFVLRVTLRVVRQAASGDAGY